MHTLPLTDEEISTWLRLVNLKGIGPVTVRRLLTAFGLPEQIFSQTYAALVRVVGAAIAHAVQQPPAADFLNQVKRTIAWTAMPGNHFVTLSDPVYPGALLHLSDPPPLLYIKGRLELLHARSIAIVGSRNATPQGLLNAEQFARTLAAAGFTVVSGLALGIDSAAHRGALHERGGTVAVMGTGMAVIYPVCHQKLAHEIVTHGTLISEWPLNAPARAQHFPRRNRLIAALAKGVLVVEAAIQSGSLITARLAGELGREVFAVPGAIHSPLVKGCHRLIKEGAMLVESAKEVLETLQPTLQSENKPAPAMPAIPIVAVNKAMDTLDANARCVLKTFGHEPMPLESLTARTGLTSAALQATILQLELSGWITTLPGGRVMLIKPAEAQ